MENNVFLMKLLLQTDLCRVDLFCVGDDEIREGDCMCCDNCALPCQYDNHIQTIEFGKDEDSPTIFLPKQDQCLMPSDKN